MKNGTEEIQVPVAAATQNHNHNHAEPVEIWKARRFIREHCGEMLSLHGIAQAVRISPNYLSERFKAVTGENLVRYIARLRVERACELLNKDQRISEIAFAVGFQSLSQFNRVFKKAMKECPREYRARQLRRTETSS